MQTTIINSLMTHLQSAAPWLRWVDIEDGQLETEGRPPVAFPCALLDLSYPQCQTLTGGRQRINVALHITVAFDTPEPSNLAAPPEVRQRSLERFDRIEELHKALQWWTPEHCLQPLRRESVVADKRFAGIKVYQLVYTTMLMA
ncbi:MAG: hypothetical protein HUK09_02615 [Bacteroidaceae bacterium]|nr:hypothetical protein [Bacteroidaceae bacterium]